MRGGESILAPVGQSDNLFKIPIPTLGEKLGYFQDIYSLTHTRIPLFYNRYFISGIYYLWLTSSRLVPHDPVQVDVGPGLAGAEGLRLSEGPRLRGLGGHLQWENSLGGGW